MSESDAVAYYQVVPGTEKFYLPEDIDKLFKREPRSFCMKCGWSGPPKPYLNGWACTGGDCGYMVHPPTMGFSLEEWTRILEWKDEHHISRD